MKTKSLLFILVIFLFLVQPASAQSVGPAWGPICSSGAILSSNFSPQPLWPVYLYFASDRQDDPDGCSWMINSINYILNAGAKTPIETFSTPVTGGLNVSFYRKATYILLFTRSNIPARVRLWYSDGTTSEVSYTLSMPADWEQYQVFIPPTGRSISAVQLTFDLGNIFTEQTSGSQIGDLFFDDFAFTQVIITPTPTRTPIPRTPTATPTSRPTLWATPAPTGTSLPTITPLATLLLPSRYSYPPTSIPALTLPTWPAVASLAQIPTPAPLAVSSPTSVARFTPAPIGDLPPTPPWNNPTPGPTPDTWADDIISYTNWLSAEVTTMQATQTITIASAPDWYAPQLPREMATIGWTFEHIGEGRYSLNSWSYLFGLMISMPIRLLKGIKELFQFMGPIGLFLSWLLLIAPGVLYLRFLQFVKATFIRIFNFLLAVVDWVLKLWQAIPWWFGGPG